MTLLKTDIDLSKTEEAEERFAPEAKQVEACAFQAQGVGSSPIRSTNDWEVEKLKNGDFNIKQVNTTIAGRDYNRLSVIT